MTGCQMLRKLDLTRSEHTVPLMQFHNRGNLPLRYKLGDWEGLNEVLPIEELVRDVYAHLVNYHDSFGPAWKRNCSQLVQ
jgi:hypothetical protein